VTTIPTYITNSSAYCNGIAMIYNGVRTNGYFEYGPTQSLGYNTSSAYIGNSVSTSYSAPISGLSAGKTYYCRAVITNANGTYKGEIMSFTTKSNPIVYVKPTVKATPVVTKKKTTYTYTPAKTSYKCIDVSGATDTIDSNEKVMEVTLEKQSGTYNIGETVLWKLTYKNIGRIMASNVNVKLVLPPELTYVSSTMGSVDANNVVNISVGTLTALNESSVIITTKVRDVATVGKTIVVTGYASYDLNTTSKTVVSDEVSSYVIGTILPALDDADSKTNNKTSINNTKSDTFLPNTLVEWLALIAILVILAVLIRNVYLAYKGDDHGHH